MLDFFQKLNKHFSSSQLLPFWFFGGLVIAQVIFNSLWIIWPLNWFINIALIIFYLVIAAIFIGAVDKVSRLDLERNQINAMVSSINDPAISYTENFEIILVNKAMEKFIGISKKELIGKNITPELSNDVRLGFYLK